MRNALLAIVILFVSNAALAQSIPAEPGLAGWRETKLNKPGLSYVLKANGCGMEHLFATMHRNEIEPGKLRHLAANRPLWIPDEATCGQPVDAFEARMSRWIIAQDAKLARQRTETAQRAAAEKLNAEYGERLGEKDREIASLKDKLQKSSQAPPAARPQPVAAARTTPTPRTGGWMLALLAFAIGTAGGGVVGRRSLRGYVIFRNVERVKTSDGTFHQFQFVEAKRDPVTGNVDVIRKCPECIQVFSLGPAKNEDESAREHIEVAHSASRVLTEKSLT